MLDAKRSSSYGYVTSTRYTYANTQLYARSLRRAVGETAAAGSETNVPGLSFSGPEAVYRAQCT